VISLLMRYWETVSCVHPWIQRLAIFLDNATSTNKNKFLFAWAMELVSRGVISHVHISFMIAGHTKFALDRLFATIGSADVFTIDELKSLCAPSATTIIESGQNVLTWRDTLGEKYADLPGVRKLHDFLFIRAHTGQVVMKVREQCFRGQWKDSLLRVVNPMVVGTPSTNYKDKHEHNIKDDKMANMVTMYDKFISPDRRPDYLPAIVQPHPTSRLTLSSATSAQAQTASTPSSAPTRQRKASKCTVNGCDGSGHCNKSRWSEGQTTKAGGPIFHAMH